MRSKENMEVNFNRDYVYPEPKTRKQVVDRLRKQVDPKVGEGREIIIAELNMRSYEDGSFTKNIWSKVLEPLHERVLGGEQ